MVRVQTWCELFEERVNDWLDARRPLQAELFFDETPPEGTAGHLTVDAALLREAGSSPAGNPTSCAQTITYSQFIRQLRSHVESCAECQTLALGYGDLQQAVWNLRSPQPSVEFSQGLAARILQTAPATSADMGSADTVSMTSAETVITGSLPKQPAKQPALGDAPQLPHLKPASLRGATAASPSGEYRSESLDQPGTVNLATHRESLLHRGNLLRRGLQFVAVAATVMIAVGIALQAPQPGNPGGGTFVSTDSPNAGTDTAPTTGRAAAPVFSTLALIEGTERGFQAFGQLISPLDQPNGVLVDRARLTSEEALQDLFGGIAPLANSTAQSTNFLRNLLPVDTADDDQALTTPDDSQ